MNALLFILNKKLQYDIQERIQNLHCRGAQVTEAPKGGGWGRGSPPPAGGGSGFFMYTEISGGIEMEFKTTFTFTIVFHNTE